MFIVHTSCSSVLGTFMRRNQTCFEHHPTCKDAPTNNGVHAAAPAFWQMVDVLRMKYRYYNAVRHLQAAGQWIVPSAVHFTDILYTASCPSRIPSQHRLPSLSFSPSDIHSFRSQLVAAFIRSDLDDHLHSLPVGQHEIILFFHWSGYHTLVTGKRTSCVQLYQWSFMWSCKGRRQLLQCCRSPGNWSTPPTGTP